MKKKIRRRKREVVVGGSLLLGISISVLGGLQGYLIPQLDYLLRSDGWILSLELLGSIISYIPFLLYTSSSKKDGCFQ